MVYQVISGGAGVQPSRWNQSPKSWWVMMFNRGTDYGFPMALTLQGWRVENPAGDRKNYQVGIPMAYKFSPISPGALHLRWATEQTPSGNWIAGFPVDFGMLIRTERGMNIGTVLRNVVIGGNRFETLKTETDFGIAYEAGVATVSVSTTGENWQDIKESKDRIKVGFELGGNRSVILRGGYVRWEGKRWYTAGIGLHSTEAGVYVDYAVVHDHSNGGFSHFIQYIYMMR
jgi:hypothetical protein